MASEFSWLFAIVQVPAKPSRHRVAVWRELRRAGAVTVAQGAWALPDVEFCRTALSRAETLAADGSGSIAVFSVLPHNEAAAGLAETAFRNARREEWQEFVADCGKFDDEIASEIAKSKFTFAELEEEEQSLDRLRRWHRDLKRRDLLAGQDAATATVRLHRCETHLADFAERVFAAEHTAQEN